MRHVVWATVLAALSTAALCANPASADAPPPMTQPPSAVASAPPPTPPLSIFETRPGGDLLHLQSGLTCPVAFGDYRRVDAIAYDQFGLDASCEYRRSDSDISVYLTRRSGTSPADSMTEAKREFLLVRAAAHPQLLAETQPAVGGLAWDLALYAVDNGLHDAVWIADLDGWTLEYRATYRAGVEPQVTADIARITAQVQASAGARLDLCAKSPPPARTGVAITDKATLSSAAMMSAILGGGALAAAADGKAIGTPQPVIWCAEQPVRTPRFPMLFWRGVHPDGSEANTDKVSVMTVGKPEELIVAADELGNLVADAKAPTNNWVATIESPDLTRVYGYFTGRPSPEVLSKLFSDILAGAVKPLIGYGDKGKSVTISMPSDK